MAKAVALIAFALGVLAIAGNVQAGFDNPGKFTKKDKFDVYDTNRFSVEGKVNSESDFKPLGRMYNVEVEIKCTSRKNGTITLIQPALADDGGFFKIYVEDGHQDDLCMVRAVASPDPQCNVKAPGFRSERITLGNFKDAKASIVYIHKIMIFIKNETLPNSAVRCGARGVI
ncbi:hypothetical protein RHMOL_Rhmol04G0043200 [Rhododendron molle]|uniref:Uncharacterized protein n=1 Tax=Rhododendron molle TaxID=49168 RepID=A0ACC0NY74_RHOML|nr:hypothetical protein RHMOL_Rhmol04G0043200 [Rhododendron molle]